MQDSLDPRRPNRSSRARQLTVATLVLGLLVAACGGSSPSSTTTFSGGTASRAASPATTSSSDAAVTGQPTPIAFAQCMRASGVPNFPDPQPGRGLLFNVSGINAAAPAVRAAQAKCRKLLAGGPPGPGSTTHPSAQTLAKLLAIARCMRAHGISQFPDPMTFVPSHPVGDQEITDFDGAILLFPSTMNLEAPAYKQALTACGAPPLGLPH
jgi:hypothetical protein